LGGKLKLAERAAGDGFMRSNDFGVRGSIRRLELTRVNETAESAKSEASVTLSYTFVNPSLRWEP
ncbi:hypothetical protein PENTCL1PPCAC_20833, partial [Pristionchus entomophagus]